MNDNDLRKAVKRRIQRNLKNRPNSLLIEELGVHHGAARIDLVLVNELIHGYELKSDSDTLDRLPDQITQYSSVFDKMTIVVGYKHAYSALQMVPDWWGVKLAHMGTRGAVHISAARSALRNPAQDSRSLAELLWRNEALDLLEQFDNLNGLRSKPRSVIYDTLATCLDIEQIREFVVKRFNSRTNWIADVLPK